MVSAESRAARMLGADTRDILSEPANCGYRLNH